ncbi:MAG: Flp1 family type IVb pilin [Bdellovibrio sp.]
MNKFKHKFKNFSKKLFKNESGQGATEYILLLVVVVALVVLFKDKIKSAFEGKVTSLSDSITKFGE